MSSSKQLPAQQAMPQHKLSHHEMTSYHPHGRLAQIFAKRKDAKSNSI